MKASLRSLAEQNRLVYFVVEWKQLYILRYDPWSRVYCPAQFAVYTLYKRIRLIYCEVIGARTAHCNCRTLLYICTEREFLHHQRYRRYLGLCVFGHAGHT